MKESVTSQHITNQDIFEAETKEMDVETIMRLVDLIFLCKDDEEVIAS